jgi:hypothetical protein
MIPPEVWQKTVLVAKESRKPVVAAALRKSPPHNVLEIGGESIGLGQKYRFCTNIHRISILTAFIAEIYYFCGN